MVHLFNSRGHQKAESVLILGRGLIGSAIERGLVKRKFKVLSQIQPDWENKANLLKQLRLAIGSCLINRPEKLDIIWAAGRAGFSVSREQAIEENRVFEDVIREVIPILSGHGIKTKLHFISSAGALFEGQINVNKRSEPRPRSAYGHMKLKQEIFLQKVKDQLVSFNIYRLSSVFGYVRPGKRMGLISSMIKNGIKKKESLIFGNYNTMRDYLWEEDMADFVAEAVSWGGESDQIFTLASCRPMNIFQTHKLIENTLGFRCFIRFSPQPENYLHNTFSPDVLPEGFIPTPVASCIPKIYFSAVQMKSYLSG